MNAVNAEEGTYTIPDINVIILCRHNISDTIINRHVLPPRKLRLLIYARMDSAGYFINYFLAYFCILRTTEYNINV